MQRQRKEIMKRIDEINTAIHVDMELGCGFAPVGAYDSMYEEMYELEEAFAATYGMTRDELTHRQMTKNPLLRWVYGDDTEYFEDEPEYVEMEDLSLLAQERCLYR